MVISFYKCNNCKLYLPKDKTCQIMIPPMQGKIEPNDYCSKHRPELYFCEVCGQGLLIPTLELAEENGESVVHTYCPNCIKIMHREEDMQTAVQNQENPSE